MVRDFARRGTGNIIFLMKMLFNFGFINFNPWFIHGQGNFWDKTRLSINFISLQRMANQWTMKQNWRFAMGWHYGLLGSSLTLMEKRNIQSLNYELSESLKYSHRKVIICASWENRTDFEEYLQRFPQTHVDFADSNWKKINAHF